MWNQNIGLAWERDRNENFRKRKKAQPIRERMDLFEKKNLGKNTSGLSACCAVTLDSFTSLNTEF